MHEQTALHWTQMHLFISAEAKTFESCDGVYLRYLSTYLYTRSVYGEEPRRASSKASHGYEPKLRPCIAGNSPSNTAARPGRTRIDGRRFRDA